VVTIERNGHKVYSGTMRRNAPALLLALIAAASCSDATAPADDEPAEYIAVRRAWAPAERDSLIARILAQRLFTFPYAGDISDMAPQLYADTDSVVVLAPNPAFIPRASGAPGTAGISMFSPSWTFVGLKIRTINTDPTPDDTTFWHMVIWSDPSDAGNHGFAIAFSRANTFNITPVNTPNFDAAFGRAGAAAGEFHQSTATFWQDNGGGGRFQVTSQTYPGAFAPITTGPYLGGQSRAGTQFGRVANSFFTRLAGSEAPATFTVSFDYRGTGLPATEIQCTFPSPCTTNALMSPQLRAWLER
jgi:hypothetical protein